MSQLKDFSQVSQEQVLIELETLDLKPEVMNFLKENPEIVKPLLEITSKLEKVFPEYPVDFNSFDGEENSLLLLIYVPEKTSDVIIKFNDFKSIWREEKYEVFQDRVILGIKVNKEDFINPHKALLNLIGPSDDNPYPADFAAEIDHYLYGTPKRYQ